MNVQRFGLQHDVLTRERGDVTKGNIRDDCHLQRGLVPATTTSDNLQEVDAATSARRVDEKKKPERNAATSVAKPGINDNDNKKVVSS